MLCSVNEIQPRHHLQATMKRSRRLRRRIHLFTFLYFLFTRPLFKTYKIQSTFLQSVLSNTLFVVLAVVVLATGVMAYTANSVASFDQLHLGQYAAAVDGSKVG